MDWKAKTLLALAGSWKGVKTNFLIPLLGRAGTALAAWLVLQGTEAELAQQVAGIVTAFGLVMFDLFVSYLNRKQGGK